MAKPKITNIINVGPYTAETARGLYYGLADEIRLWQPRTPGVYTQPEPRIQIVKQRQAGKTDLTKHIQWRFDPATVEALKELNKASEAAKYPNPDQLLDGYEID